MEELKERYKRTVSIVGLIAYTLPEEHEEELPTTGAWTMIKRRELAAGMMCSTCSEYKIPTRFWLLEVLLAILHVLHVLVYLPIPVLLEVPLLSPLFSRFFIVDHIGVRIGTGSSAHLLDPVTVPKGEGCEVLPLGAATGAPLRWGFLLPRRGRVEGLVGLAACMATLGGMRCSAAERRFKSARSVVEYKLAAKLLHKSRYPPVNCRYIGFCARYFSRYSFPKHVSPPKAFVSFAYLRSNPSYTMLNTKYIRITKRVQYNFVILDKPLVTHHWISICVSHGVSLPFWLMHTAWLPVCTTYRHYKQHSEHQNTQLFAHCTKLVACFFTKKFRDKF